MKRKQWTFLLLGSGERAVRQYTVSSVAVRRILVVSAIAVSTGAGLTVAALLEGSARVHARHVELKNTALTAELGRIQTRVEGLEATLVDIAERDGAMRVLAGLDAFEDDVLEVGVGGPGLGTPESNPLFSFDEELGETAFAVMYDLNAMERRTRLLAESMDEATDSLTAHRDLLESTPSILPTAGFLSSRFSRSRIHPIHNVPRPHEGVDISARHGTPIRAAANGRVVRSGWRAGLGQMVEIDHGFGFKTIYGHASKLLVRMGQSVERGDVIAQVGRTGTATSSHLHYEVHVNGRPRNPLNYVLSGSVP